jgi:hypothetical protein
MFSRCLRLIVKADTSKGSLEAMAYDRWNAARDMRNGDIRFREAERYNGDFGNDVVVNVLTKLDV